MSNTDRLQGGMKHAPGVMCLVAIPTKFYPECQDNGKIVKLKEKVTTRRLYYCGCGSVCTLNSGTRWGTIWIADATNGELLTCDRGVKSPEQAFPQKFLIPLGDSSLIEREKWEATNPKEDALDRGISVILSSVHNRKKEHQS